MNKLTIPTILVATVMVAGIFAFMPVEQASTVHTSGTITIANDAITAAKIATDAIGASELADAVEPLSNVLTVYFADLTTTANITCGAGDAFLVHYIIEGVTTTSFSIDLTDDNTDEDTFEFTTGEGLLLSGTLAGAAGATVEITGSAATVQGFITVQCTGNGTPAIT